MEPVLKYVVVGLIIGGTLPLVLHLLGITVFLSLEDFIAHGIGAVIGGLIGLIVYRLINK